MKQGEEQAQYNRTLALIFFSNEIYAHCQADELQCYYGSYSLSFSLSLPICLLRLFTVPSSCPIINYVRGESHKWHVTSPCQNDEADDDADDLHPMLFRFIQCFSYFLFNSLVFELTYKRERHEVRAQQHFSIFVSVFTFGLLFYYYYFIAVFGPSKQPWNNG